MSRVDGVECLQGIILETANTRDEIDEIFPTIIGSPHSWSCLRPHRPRPNTQANQNTQANFSAHINSNHRTHAYANGPAGAASIPGRRHRHSGGPGCRRWEYRPKPGLGAP